MRVKVTVTDDNGQTESYEGTSADNFDCWEVTGSSRINKDADELIGRTLGSVGDHYEDIQAEKK